MSEVAAGVPGFLTTKEYRRFEEFSTGAFPTKKSLFDEVAAWEAERNKNHTKADWQFTTGDARVNLTRQYPAF
jgi:hypothetical protein